MKSDGERPTFQEAVVLAVFRFPVSPIQHLGHLDLFILPGRRQRLRKEVTKVNLKKAIELGEYAEKSLRHHKFIDHADAVRILIEAGERCKAYKEAHVGLHYELLPGETEE